MEKLIQDFIRYASKMNLPIESICLSNKNGIILEHHFINVYKKNIYSHTKNFVSIAIGSLIDLELISLDSKLVDLLYEEIPNKYHQKLKDITVSDLLTMSSSIGSGLLFGDARYNVSDMIEEIARQEIVGTHGRSFCYSNGDVYLLSRIIEKVTGFKAQKYIYQTILRPLNISYPAMETDMDGHMFGASGMYLSIADMNKLGILCLNNGIYNGKRIVSEDWIKKISEPKILTHEKENIGSPRYGWNTYYSYLFWMMPYEDSYRADGMFGQYTIVFSKLGYALSLQCPEENSNLDLVISYLNKYVFDKLDLVKRDLTLKI